MERDLKFSCGINENGVLYVPYREVMGQIEKSCGDGFNDGMAKGSIGNDEESIRTDERAKIVGDCLTILKTMHMLRTSEEDFNSKIETPFYRELYAKIKELGEEQK